ncbi:hypothetical protein GCM10027085_34550 [Spirosoma aerophilum]
MFGGINRTTPILFDNQQTFLAPQTNLTAGLDVFYPFSQRSSLHLQPSWASVSYGKTTSKYWNQLNFNISSIKIPLLYRYYFLTSSVSPFFDIGVGYNQAVSGSYTIQIPCDFCDYTTGGYTYTYGLSNKSAMSVLGSIGTRFRIKKVSIPVLLRYERYLNSQSFATDVPVYNPRVQFQHIALLMGITF